MTVGDRCIDQRSIRTSPRHPSDRISDQRRSQTTVPMRRRDGEALHIARRSAQTADSEPGDRTSTLVRSRRPGERSCTNGVSERSGVVRPARPEGNTIDGGSVTKMPTMKRANTTTGPPSVTVIEEALKQQQFVDRTEADSGYKVRAGGAKGSSSNESGS